MIKYLFSIINPLLLLLFGFLNGDGDISITNNIPSNIQVANEVELEFKINKANTSGYAIFELTLPNGFTAVKELDHKRDATYIYEGNTVKWRWDTLPESEVLNVKVSIMVSEEALGNKTITAKYFYEEGNEKKEVEMQPAMLRVLSQYAETPGQPEIEARQEPPGIITGTRSISKISDKEYLIRVKINKGITGGFAKYSDDANINYTYLPRETNGSSFSISDGKIKFVWVNVPNTEILEISYSIMRNYIDTINLNGEYSYLENNQSKVFKLNADLITNTREQELVQTNLSDSLKQTQETTTVETERLAKLKTTEQDTLKTEQKVTANNAERVEKEADGAEKLVKLKEEETTKLSIEHSVSEKNASDKNQQQPKQSLEMKESSINYMVQIGAFTKPTVNIQRFQKKFKITDKITSEMQGGFSKFMIGFHNQYKDARDHREQVKEKNGVKSAFVVAYDGAKRVTVQEALMITNQKWFK